MAYGEQSLIDGGELLFNEDDAFTSGTMERVRALGDGPRCMDADPEVFFPEKGQSASPAKLICHSCSVKVECGDIAIEEDEPYGVWGAMTTRERRAEKRRREQRI